MLAIQVCLYKCSWDIQMIMRGDSISRSACTSISVLLSYLFVWSVYLKNMEKKNMTSCEFQYLSILWMNENIVFGFCMKKPDDITKCHEKAKKKLCIFISMFSTFMFLMTLWFFFVWESIILYDWTFFPHSRSQKVLSYHNYQFVWWFLGKMDLEVEYFIKSSV